MENELTQDSALRGPQVRTTLDETSPQSFLNSFSGLKTKGAERVEAALGTLNAGQAIFLDTEGVPHTGRSRFYQRQVRPLATFYRSAGQSEVEIYPGILPSKPLFCRWYPVQGAKPLLQGPLQGPIVARSGDVLYLGRECAVQIPSKVELGPLSPGECLAFMLAVAKPGDTVSLGRAGMPSLDGAVSRIHCSAKVLSKDVQDDGSFFMRVSAFPGIPGSEKVVLWRENSQLEILESAATLRTGDRLWFGDAVGDVTVPRLST